jgi:hypothetical protein
MKYRKTVRPERHAMKDNLVRWESHDDEDEDEDEEIIRNMYILIKYVMESGGQVVMTFGGDGIPAE